MPRKKKPAGDSHKLETFLSGLSRNRSVLRFDFGR
jgi:hypothetical protein